MLFSDIFDEDDAANDVFKFESILDSFKTKLKFRMK
jgi:hypothetical protein